MGTRDLPTGTLTFFFSDIEGSTKLVQRVGLRFKDLLGVSLDELRELIAAEDARRAIREEFPRTEDPVRRRQLLEEALGHLDRQLELVHRRAAELAALEGDLAERRARVVAGLERSPSAARS